MLGTISIRFPLLVIALWFAIGATSVAFLPGLGSVAQNHATAFLPDSAPSLQAAGLNSSFQDPSIETGTLVAVTRDGALSSQDLSSFETLEQRVRRIGSVSSVVDEGISSDQHARTALIETDIGQFSQTQEATPVVAAIRRLFPSAERATGIRLHLTGPLADEVDQADATGNSATLTTLLSLLLIVVILLFVFRSILAMLFAIVPPVIAYFAAAHIVGALSGSFLGVTSLTQFLLIVVLLGAGTDYGLFLIFRFSEQSATAKSPSEALDKAVRMTGETVFVSAVVVMVAFLTLLLASFPAYRGLGFALAISVAILALIELTLLPAFITVAGRYGLWPRCATTRRSEARWDRVATATLGHPIRTLIVGVTILGGLALFAIDYSSAAFGGTDISPTASDSGLGAAAIAAHFPAAEASPSYVVFDFIAPMWRVPGTLLLAQQIVDSSPSFRSVAGPLDPNGTQLTYNEISNLYERLGPPNNLSFQPPNGPISVSEYEAYRAVSSFLSSDGTVLRFEVALKAGGPNSNAVVSSIPAIRSEVASDAARLGAIRSGFLDDAAFTYDETHLSNDDLLRIVPIVLLAMALLLVLVFRSVVAAILMIASVLLSYAATIGLVVLLFVIIGGQSGVNFVVPLLAFVFLMALCQDYNILMTRRIAEQARREPLDRAIGHALARSGATISSAGIILAGTFFVLSAAAPGSVRQIGVGIACGILLDTFVVRTLLLPTAARLLGPLLWWPSSGPPGAGQLPPVTSIDKLAE